MTMIIEQMFYTGLGLIVIIVIIYSLVQIGELIKKYRDLNEESKK